MRLKLHAGCGGGEKLEECLIIPSIDSHLLGAYLFRYVDIKIEGTYPLEFKRFYNSLDASTSTLGRNWTHSYDIKIREIEDSGATIIYGDSRQEFFGKPKEEDENIFVSTPGNFNRLKKLEDDKGYELGFTEGGKYLFNKDGQLTYQIDQVGNEVKLSYDEDQLINVESSSGHFELVYDGEYIEKITDHTGRIVSYEYENDLLSTYTNVLGNSYSHEYDVRKRLVTITNPEGNLVVSNDYDVKDRIIKQSYADGSEMLYKYNEYGKRKNTTDFIKQNGSKFTYKRDDQYRTTGIVEPDGEIKIEYNENSQRSKYIDKLGGETSFEYDEVGNISKVTNALGIVTELEYVEDSSKIKSVAIDGNRKVNNSYDDAGNLVRMQDALANETTITYRQNDLPETITQADGSQVQLSYDERGNVIQVKNASGAITEYKYNEHNQVISTIDGNKNETKFTYDLQGNITKVENAEGNTQSFKYNKANKVTRITDFNGGIIKREYNELGKLSKVIDPLERVTTLDYDNMWNVSKVIETNGAQTQLLYNEMNYLEAFVKPDKSKVSYEYDLNGNRTKIIDEEGNATHLRYDVLGQLIEVTGEENLKYVYTYNVERQITSVTDALDNTVNLDYNVLGQLIKETNALDDTRTYTYTSIGKIETVTDEANRVMLYEYELGGRLKSIQHPDGTNESFTYDPNGNVKTHTNKTGQTTIYNYDNLNRTVSIESNGGIKYYTYDPMSNVTSMTDELGNITKYTYTLMGQLQTVTDALGGITSYKYDVMNNLIEVHQEGSEILGHDGILDDVQKLNKENQGLRITKYHRNIMGQVESVEDALGINETYTYSLKGQLIEKLDKDGFLTKYGYTAHGDVAQVQYADGREVKLQYNTLRQLTEITDWLGSTKIDVDPLGKATRVTYPNSEVIEYLYNALGQRESIVYPDGKQVTYSFDDSSRLMKVNDGTQEINYHYDQYSRLIGKHFGANTRSEYGYDNLGHLSELSHFGSDGLTDKYVYGYDLLGNKTSIEKQRQGMEADSGLFNFEYDQLNRLQLVTKDGNLLRSYNYDSFGNRISMVESGNEINYHFNTLNQLISSTDGMNYNYDGRGNLIEAHQNDQLVNKHHFGALNRLESTYNFEKNLGATYQYNGLGHRVGRTEGVSLKPILPTVGLKNMELNPTKQVDDVLDLTRAFQNLLWRKENGSTQQFTYDFGVLSSSGSNGQHSYLLDDLGSPARLMDGVGSELDVFGYNEFGTPLHDAQNANSAFSFTGYQIDPVSNTNFAQARQYDPKTGRFVSEDVFKGFMEVPLTLNSYAYCWNQPFDFVDLDGRRRDRNPFPLWPEAYQVVEDNAEHIIYAANHFDINPATLASVIYAEHYLNVSLRDTITDGIGGFYGLNTSIGVAQVRVNTARYMEEMGFMPPITRYDGGWDLPFIGRVHGTETMARAVALEDPRTNIMYAAAYLRYYQDGWSEYGFDTWNTPWLFAVLYNQRANDPHPNPILESPFGKFAQDSYELMYELLGFDSHNNHQLGIFGIIIGVARKLGFKEEISCE